MTSAIYRQVDSKRLAIRLTFINSRKFGVR